MTVSEGAGAQTRWVTIDDPTSWLGWAKDLVEQLPAWAPPVAGVAGVAVLALALVRWRSRRGGVPDRAAPQGDVVAQPARTPSHESEASESLRELSDLAQSNLAKGDFLEAYSKFELALEGRKDMYGPEHPDTLASMAWVAAAAKRLGNFERAKNLEVQASQTMTRLLGPEHPNTLSSILSLGQTAHLAGEFDEAQKLIEHVVEVLTRTLGPTHPDTKIATEILAMNRANIADANAPAPPFVDFWLSG